MDFSKIKLKCIKCKYKLKYELNCFYCKNCSSKFFLSDGVFKFAEDNFHSNFAFQWKLFNKTQLDSFNLSTESNDRFFGQSRMLKNDFQNKKILEVGSGAGRFTEILKEFNSQIFTVDYSEAIKANYENNKKKNVIFFQADIFNLPFYENYFDIVICYGVLQHTGNNQKAIDCLAKLTNNLNGILLLDIYSNSLRHYNPWIYLIRFFIKFLNISDKKKFTIVNKSVNILFPFYLYLFNKLNKYNNNLLIKYFKFFLNRAPISVYGINLYLQKKINKKVAKEWSLLDTYDAWTPKFDHPVSKVKWNGIIEDIREKYNYKTFDISVSGQGYTAKLIK